MPVEGTAENTGRSWAWTLGLEWSREPPGLVSVFTPSPEHRGPPGLLHGGLAAAVLDETMAALGWATEGVHTVTASLELRYRAPVALDGRPVRTEAWRDRPGTRRVHKVHGRLVTAGGIIAVEATGLFVRVDSGPDAEAVPDAGPGAGPDEEPGAAGAS